MLTLAATETLRGVAGSASAITYTVTGDEKTTSNAYKVLAQGQLPSSAGTLYTAPGSTAALIQRIMLANTTAGAVTVSLYINGTAAGNLIVSLSVPANGSAMFTHQGWRVLDSSGVPVTTATVTLTGDVTGTGTSTIATTLATVNGNVGSFGTASNVAQFTVNAKGLTTAAANVPIQITESQVTNLVTDLAGKQATGNYITALTTDVTASGPGSVAATIANNAVTNAKAADMAANTIKANITAALADPQDAVIAANQFLARDSTGTLTQKTITDSGLGWLALASTAAQTAALNVATTSLQGMLSAADKKQLDNMYYDAAADFGFVGDDSTLNDTAWTTAKAAMPLGSTLFFPAGTYRFANEITIDVDKRFQFRGAGRYISIIKTTSATANIFAKTVAGWYDSWTDLGFSSTVTKTGGAAIAVTAGNNVGMNVYRCWFSGNLFYGINYDGNQSGNLSILNDLDMSSFANGGRGIRINGATINIEIHNATINMGAATTSACCEIVASGAVQVTNCDWIQGTNVVLMNPTAALGPQAVYFTNCFFDQPQSHVISITGTFTTNRVKFTQCGIATAAAATTANAVNINGTGAGAAGTTTAMPGGISIVDCDIYHAAGNSTAAGIAINGVQDVNIANSRITGYGGAGGAGIKITPTATTSVRINGCIIGPNSNLTVVNSTGVAVSSGTLQRLIITDNSIRSWTTAGISDASTTTFATDKNINNNDGAQLIAGGVASSSNQSIAAATLTQVTGTLIPLPANLIRVGTVLRWTINGATAAAAGTAANTIQIRIGTAGTTADAVHQTFTTPVGTATAGIGFHIVLEMVISAVGGSATSNALCTIVNGSASTGLINVYNFIGVGTATAFNSANNNFAHIALTTGASKTLNLTGAFCEVVSP